MDPTNALAYYNLGVAFSMLGKNNEAVDSYKKAIEMDPTNALAYNNLGVALINFDSFDETVTSYHKAIELDHNVRNTYENFKWLLLNKLKTAGRLAESVMFLEGIIAQYPDN